MLAQSLCLQLAFIRRLPIRVSVKFSKLTEIKFLQLAGKTLAMERLWAIQAYRLEMK